MQISKGEKCKKKSKGRSRSEKDEYAECWRRTDQAKPRDQEKMNNKRGGEGEAKLPPVFLQRQRCRPKKGS